MANSVVPGEYLGDYATSHGRERGARACPVGWIALIPDSQK